MVSCVVLCLCIVLSGLVWSGYVFSFLFSRLVSFLVLSHFRDVWPLYFVNFVSYLVVSYLASFLVPCLRFSCLALPCIFSCLALTCTFSCLFSCLVSFLCTMLIYGKEASLCLVLFLSFNLSSLLYCHIIFVF